MIITIDTGSRCSGLAVWDGALVAALAVQADGPLEMAERVSGRACVLAPGEVESIYVEYPHDQRRGARTDDLIKLAATAGAIAARLEELFDVRPEFLLPSAWKGSTPKPKRVADPYVVAVRAQRTLSAYELERVQLPTSVQQQWDVWDAVGIGLWASGRLRRGLVP